MTNRAHDAYVTQRILSADPVELVCMLYAGACEAVETARARLAARDIRGRSTAISKALKILFELAGALDRDRAPELGRNLAVLYDYMERRLIEANLRQVDAPLAEVLGLLRTLAEAWKSLAAATPAATPVAAAPQSTTPVWPPVANPCEPEPALHGWSF